LTTHSPTVASVAPLSNIVVLRRIPDENHSIGKSLRRIGLKKSERQDLERYIDVTRGEMFFSKAVILVEGDAEKFLLPTLAKFHDPELGFDELGITVCSIGGTNFGPYIRLLGPEGLDIPFVVLTDFDPKGEQVSQQDADPDDPGVVDSYGENRVVNQIMRILMDKDEWKKLSFEKILRRAEKSGVFLNTFTFEVDLFKTGAEKEFAEAIKGLTSNTKMHRRFDELSVDPESLDPKQFLKDIDSIGKGRVAQRLASIFLAKNLTFARRTSRRLWIT
jgi:putative ATP-dependent endonuclease of the OLD family